MIEEYWGVNGKTLNDYVGDGMRINAVGRVFLDSSFGNPYRIVNNNGEVEIPRGSVIERYRIEPDMHSEDREIAGGLAEVFD